MSYTIGRVEGNAVTEYIRFGSGKKNLVIIPGLSVQSIIPSAEAIENQYNVFSNDFTVYVFDRRSNLFGEYSVYVIAEDTAEAMTKLNIDNACVFGTSQGGMAAMTLAVKHPSLVGALAVCSSSAFISDERFSQIEKWITLAEKGQSEELYLAFAKSIFPESVFNGNREVFIALSETVTETDLKRFVTLAKGTRGFDIRAKLRSISCPVFVVGDSSDEVLGVEASYEIARLIDEGAEVYIYEGFGHAVYDVAEDFPKKLYNFFNSK